MLSSDMGNVNHNVTGLPPVYELYSTFTAIVNSVNQSINQHKQKSLLKHILNLTGFLYIMAQTNYLKRIVKL